jgi:hypothetical protein
MKEQLTWKPVMGYEGLYEVSDSGIVQSILRLVKDKSDGIRIVKQKVLLQRIDRGGYLTVRLTKEGYTATHYVHRILGRAFISNPENKPCINHLNGCKTDNHLENLEWVTRSENARHAFKAGLSRVPQQCLKKVIDTRTGKIYSSIREAANGLHIRYSTCKNYLNGNRPNPTSLRFYRPNTVVARENFPICIKPGNEKVPN